MKPDANMNIELQQEPKPSKPKSEHEAALPNEAAFIDEKQLLTRLPVSRRTIHNWRTAGKIPSIKIGRRVLFCWENVSAALRRLERGSE
jgi:predicted DNA-binding transcriptional regulator AlpA